MIRFLSVPLPVPAKLFWSLTDPETRSEIVTDQGKAALRSLFELKGKTDSGSIDLYFGPNAIAPYDADQQAWNAALRPKRCVLAVNRELRDVVASKLILD
jgi:hypothetical protein